MVSCIAGEFFTNGAAREATVLLEVPLFIKFQQTIDAELEYIEQN